MDRAEAKKIYARPLSAPEGALSVYHLGHSLVGRLMPAMLEQLAGEGHRYRMQLGHGATLKGHWEHPQPPLRGFETENDSDKYRDAKEAIDSKDYDVLVLTEMVELKDAIKYHDSPEYLARLAARARAAQPNIRLYLYETWHSNDQADFRQRLDQDLAELWEGKLLFGALARDPKRRPIYLIPGGQVVAAVARRIDAEGGLPGLAKIEGLFRDNIHLSDLGCYLIALTHYAVIYQHNPLGLPHQLKKPDGTAAAAPPEALAKIMQEIVWQVVTSLPETGVAPQREGE
ncbi:MAG: hypothetical protein CSA62_05710 [Planctomycetota bacterium]|nr:MAG: hypothetical protein CSA62_05710 [Planctomycetota bacterium]